MSKFLATVATIFIIVLIVALAAPHMINWNDYRGVFENQASRLVGRQVRVGGNVKLVLLPTPEFSFEKVQIAGADGRFTEPFAEARAFEMVLSLGQLLSGAIEAKRVELINPVFRFSVDASGRSNWASLGPKDLSEAVLLAPREVTLKDVEIRGGVIELRTPYDPAPIRLEGISGQFDANALNGPFKFSGNASLRGHKFDLRLATNRYENGGFKLRASVHNAGRGEEYLLDGDLSGLDGPLTFRGPLTVRADLAGPGKGGAHPRPDSGEMLEIKGQSLLTLGGAKFDDLNLTVVRQDRPQTLTGSARADWGARSRLELSLSTRLLDLDPFLPRGAGRPASAETVAALLPQFLGGLPYTPREGVLKVDAEQLVIGEDAVENLSLELAKDGASADGKWRVSAARATLPGESQLTVSGAFQDPGGGYQFAGAIDAKGANLVKLLKWFAPDYDLSGDGEPQRFALRGKVTAGPGGAAIEGASGELAGATFTGSGRYERAGAGAASGKLAIAAEANRLDLRPLFGENEGLASLIGGEEAPAEGVKGGAAQDKPAAKGQGKGLLEAIKAGVASNDSQIDVRTGVLLLPGFEGRNVAAKLRIRDGAIDISKLSVTGDGLAVHADGRLEHYRENPEGALKLTVQADKAASLKTLALLLGAPEAVANNDRRLEALAPVRLEGAFTAARGAGLAELRLAGVAGGSAISATGKLRGAPSKLWEGEIGFSASLNNPSGSDLLRQIAPRADQRDSRTAGRPSGPGALSVKAEGSLKGLVEVNAELRTSDVEARFVGKAAPSTTPWTMDGRLSAKAQDAAGALAMLDLASADAPVHGGLELNAAMTKSGGHYEFTNAVLRLEGGRAEGRGSVDLDGETPAISATVASDEASLPRLLGLFVETSGSAAPSAATASDAVWPDRPFAFSMFDAMSGSLTLKAQTLNLGGGVNLDESQLEAKLNQGVLRLGKLTGRLWGGKFKAEGALGTKALGKSADAGGGATAGIGHRASLNASISLDHADLKKLPHTADGRALAKGYGDLRLSVSGEGLSPHGLAAVLSGQGSLRLENGALYGLAPQAIGKAAKTFLGAPKRPDGGVARIVGDEFRNGVFPYRAASAAVNVSNGVLQVSPTLLRSTRGAARVSATLDLSNLKADSEWELRGRSQKMPRKQDSRPDYMPTAQSENWPPLKLVLAGPLARFGALPMQIEADEFERSLTIRKMERDVERLEKLTPPGAPVKPGTPGRVENDVVVGDGTATGTLPQAEPAAAGTPGTEPSPSDVKTAPVDDGAGTAPVATAAPSQPPQPQAPGSGLVQPAASSWRAQTEGAPAANASPEEGAPSSTGFESRMKNAIGTPEPSSRTGQQPAPSPAPAGAGKQEAQAKKPAPAAPAQAPKPSNDLFDWLR